MTRKQGIRAIVFILILSIVIFILLNIFTVAKKHIVVRRYNEFYEEPNGTIDGIILGTSVSHRGWSAPVAWGEYGITVLPMASNVQPLVLSTSIIEEVRKTQDIKFVIIDLHNIRDSVFSNTKESSIRWVTDNMKPSLNRFKAVKKALDFVQRSHEITGNEMLLDPNDISFYIPFIKYHSRWEEGLKEIDFVRSAPTMKGIYEKDAFVTKAKLVERPEFTDEAGELSELAKEVLNEIIDYGKKNNIEIVFLSVPSYLSLEQQKEINAAFKIAEEAGCYCVDMNTNEMYDQIGILTDRDLKDKLHLNAYGARKITRYMSNFLIEKLDLPDKRGNSKYTSWDKAWKDYSIFMEEGIENPK